MGAFGYPEPDQEMKLEIENLIENEVVESVTTLPTETPKRKEKSQGTSGDRTKLLRNLLGEYDKRVNPDDVKVDFGMLLFDFKVREERNAIESYVWLNYQWVDSRLAWDPKDYGGVEVLRLGSSEVWKPDVTLYNSADPVNMINCWETNTVIWPNGNVMFIPPCKMTSTCKLNLRREPYGEQKCSMKLGSWTYDGNILDLQLRNGGNSSFDLSQFELNNSSGFEILSTTAERNERFYSCCEEPYIDITFNMTIRRLPGDELFHKL
jgi:nicotinic acetylcholine receptor